MKTIFDSLSNTCSREVTKAYSTSFATATRLLEPNIRKNIYNVYGFVRFADEIVDSFHDWDKVKMLDKFERDFYEAYDDGISLNPILNSFQQTVKDFNIDLELVDAFLKSMKMDLDKNDYSTQEDYETYIYGSADVVGLMCLKIFVGGDAKKYAELKSSAMSLGSAFQKVNFLRDFKNDVELLNRSYFPNVNFNHLSNIEKDEIIAEIKADFAKAYEGIVRLPHTSRFGVYTAYVYYKKLLHKLEQTPSAQLKEVRVRVSNPHKFGLLLQSYVNVKLNLL